MKTGRALGGLLAVVALGALVAPRDADAFCGFYVSGADAKLFNNATQVVLMREGTRTVLSMQNAYQGPPENFAMVVPVPVVLQKENVKTLPRAIFDRVDQLTAPRLVEYWERDPCEVDAMEGEVLKGAGVPMAPTMAAAPPSGYGVKIEAQFTVGEYEVVILSASDSSGLDRWLRDNKYKIPAGAEPYLRPYVQSGSKFFVAKVDVAKVTMEAGQAVLSPLRFHYDSDTFSLPVRLGLINSSGTQDLIVNILSRGQRYEVSNYANVTIPTNLDLADEAKEKFGPFYAALFDRTMEQKPNAVVTEYSWDASSCDPCPNPALDGGELLTLGADALPSSAPPPPPPPPVPPPRPGAKPTARPPAPPMPPPMWSMPSGFVITRLHARYKKDALGEDLVFRAAPPIQGGREMMSGPNGQLEKGATAAGMNNFQGRYAIRHPWKGKIECEKPVRNRWGGPPGTGRYATGGPPVPASKIQFVARGGVQLASIVREDVPEIGLKSLAAPVPSASPASPASTAAPATTQTPKAGGCAGCTTAPRASGWGGLALAAAALVAAIRRRRGSRA